MAAAAEIQSGRAQIFGIAPITITPSPGTAISGNASNMRWSMAWKEEEQAAQNGATVESLIASQLRRTLEIDFAPAGVLGGTITRAQALAECAKILALLPNHTIQIAAEDILATGDKSINGTYNYKGGATITRTRDGVGVAGIKLEQYETAATDGAYAALATISG
jgi:hypothetical protein